MLSGFAIGSSGIHAAPGGEGDTTFTEVFDTPDPDPAPRVSQARDVTSLVPARLLDTRSGSEQNTIDSRYEGIGQISSGATLAIDVAGRGGVPDDAAAAFFNVTAIKPTGTGYLTIFPCDEAQPLASNLNYRAGDVVPNAVLAKLGDDGSICIFARTSTHVALDVAGFVPAASDTTALVPARLLDTRSGGHAETIDGQLEGVGGIQGGDTLTVAVAGRGGVPAAATAAMLNITVVSPAGSGFLTAYPCGEPRPLASNVNFRSGDRVANAALTKLGVDGTVCIYAETTTDVVIDVAGAVGAGTGTTPVVPARVLETRDTPNASTIDGAFEGIGILAAGSVTELQVTGRGGVPGMGVGAVMLNVTAAGPEGTGYLTMFPCGSQRPLASNVNYRTGDVVANAVLARTGNSGTVCIYARSAVDVVIDVNGWFEIPPNQPDSNVTVLAADDYSFASISNPDGKAAASAPVLDPNQPLVPDPEIAEITTDTSSIEVGDMVVVTKPSGEPYYGKVEEKTDTQITTKQVALAEVLPTMDVALSADTDTGEVATRNGGEAVGNVDIDPNDTSTKVPNDPPSSSGDCRAEANIDVSASATADAGKFVFDVSFGVGGLDSARIGYNPSISATGSVTVLGKAGCSWSKTLFEKQLPTIKFTIGPIPVWITQELSVGVAAEISAQAQGSRSITATAEAFVGIVYENGQWDREASITLDVEQDTTTDIQISATLSAPTVTYSARAYGIIGFDATVSANLSLTYRPLAKKYLQLTASIDVEVALVIELDLALFAVRWSQPFINATLWGPVELWSLAESVTECETNWPSGLSSEQCYALVDLYDIADGGNWTNADDWGENTDPCTWNGVTCNGGFVKVLDLDGWVDGFPHGVNGPLPTELGDLSGLEELYLSRSTISSVPTSIGDLANLRILTLDQTGIRSLPSSIGAMTSLQELWINFNEISSLPPTIGDMTSLQELNAKSNNLTTIPRQIGDLASLTFLDLRNNQLGAVPASVNQLSSLETLMLETNLFQTLPPIGDLDNLHTLFIGDGRLTALPEGIGDLDSLSYLEASRAFLRLLPDELGDQVDLGNLHIYDNPIQQDITEPMRRLRLNSPNVSLEINRLGCVTISDPVVRNWIEAKEPSWDEGC